jgi:hypothetical protein
MDRVIRYSGILAFLVLCLGAVTSIRAQSSGTSGSVSGTVVDPSGAVVVGATVEIQNPVSGFNRTGTTDSSGNFIIQNVPFNPYHLTIMATGFDGYFQDVSVNSTVPILLKIALKITGATTSVRVEASGEDLLETDSTAHTDIDRALFEKLPLESASSSLSSSRWRRRELRRIRTASFTDSATTPQTRFPSTTNRSPTSKVRCSRINCRWTPCNPWK